MVNVALNPVLPGVVLPPPPTVPFQAVSILLCLNTCLLSNEILSPFLPFHLLVHSKVIFI